MAAVIDRALRRPDDPFDVGAVASGFGYSRAHFSRAFTRLVGESPAAFVRRIRLESAAYRLAGSRVSDVAALAGYEASEAFARAFRRAFQVSPSAFAASGLDWRLPSPEDLHWNPDRDPSADFGELRKRYPGVVGRGPELALAVVRHLGSYAKLDIGWAKVASRPGRLWAAVYYDDIWTCPHSDLMRSDLGFVLRDGEPAPAGMSRLVVPGGLSFRLVDAVYRERRNEAWSYVSACWPEATWGFDLYDDHPLPFDDVRTRIEVRLT
jgi:AraC-like DNA-binding protein